MFFSKQIKSLQVSEAEQVQFTASKDTNRKSQWYERYKQQNQEKKRNRRINRSNRINKITETNLVIRKRWFPLPEEIINCLGMVTICNWRKWETQKVLVKKQEKGRSFWVENEKWLTGSAKPSFIVNWVIIYGQEIDPFRRIDVLEQLVSNESCVYALPIDNCYFHISELHSFFLLCTD